jgi:hypothetical protein
MNSLTLFSRICSRMRGFTGLTRDTKGPFRWTRPVDHPACACAVISSATLYDVPPGNRKSDTIRTSTCRLADSSWDATGSMSAETSGQMACVSASCAGFEHQISRPGRRGTSIWESPSPGHPD